MDFCRNELLAGLPADVLDALRPYLQPVVLSPHQTLHEIGAPIDEVYFVESGLVSLTADTGDHDLVEVGMTGRDGMTGAAVLFNPRAIAAHLALVQVGGSAFCVRAGILREHVGRYWPLRDRCLRYLQLTMVEASQAAACNARHQLPQRLARWLLTLRDRLESDDLPVTQEFISSMLGVRRAGVSAAANALQSRGLIRQARAHIILLDRTGLEAEACCCFHLIKNARQQIMAESK